MNTNAKWVLGLLTVTGLCIGVASCDDDEIETRVADAEALHDDEFVEFTPATSRTPADGSKSEPHIDHRPPATMPEARAAFDQVLELIETKYVDGPLPEDVVWSAAAEGVLSRLIQVEGAQINKLMSPRDLEELKIGTQGQLVGVGVMIEMVADVVVVREVIAGGPAQKAGLESGDRILGIDGERLKGKSLMEIVDKIRGSEGTTVSLFVQRDTEEWDAELTRARIDYSSVDSRMLGDSVGYLRIFEFSKSTAEDVAAQLKELRAAGMKSLILDVRNCPGGLLDASIEVTDLFLPAGRRIMTTADRDGNEKHFDTQDDGPFEELPIVAVVGPYTASGAEILTSALQHHGRARVIGTRTMGKGTVESIHELDNGWALKLSISRFSSAAGEPMLGRGVTPDIEIPMSDKPRRGPIGDVNAAADPQLSAALALSKD